MSDAKAIMHHKYNFDWDSAPDPDGAAYVSPVSPDHLAGFKGAYF